MEPGDLQPLQNLIQLTTLNLQACFRLTGQSVCKFIRVQFYAHATAGVAEFAESHPDCNVHKDESDDEASDGDY